MDLYLNYGIVVIAVILFGIGFACTDKFRIYCGSGMGSALLQTAVGSGISALILFIVNGFKFEISPVSFIVALALAVDFLLFALFSLKALERINLSLYSLFSMLGGMLLPFVAGIIFFNESLTIAKCVCFAVICIALFIATEKGEKKGGYIYYAAIFILNGMAGVLTTVFKKLDGDNVSSIGFTLLCAVVAALLSAIPLPFFRKELKTIKNPLSAIVMAILGGTFNRAANLFLVVALAVLPASAQYPMVTGGVMIASTVIAFFSKRKPSKKEILSVILAFIGIMALVLIPV